MKSKTTKNPHSKMNIVIYTNILTPYRRHFYDALYSECKKKGDSFSVLLMSESEPNRNWHYDDYKADYTILLHSKTIIFHGAYIHLNKNLMTVLSGLNPDIVICAGSYLCPGILSVLEYKNKYKYITYFWSESHLNEQKDVTGAKSWIREQIRNSVYKRFDGFWYAGKLSKQFIEKYALPIAKYIFVPNIVDEKIYKRDDIYTAQNRYAIRKKYGLNTEKILLFCPARLTKVKGIDKIIPIMGMSTKKSEIELAVAGEGEMKNEIESLAKVHDIDCKLLGYQDQNSVAELYAASDYLLLPSLSDPNPLSCVEALWAGLPLVISKHCGNYLEVVENGINGYVFDYTNTAAAVKVFDELERYGSAWYNEARVRSIQIANNGYCTEKVVKDILSELRSGVLISGHPFKDNIYEQTN